VGKDCSGGREELMDDELVETLKEMRRHYRKLMDPVDRGRKFPGLRSPVEERFRRWHGALDEAIKTIECIELVGPGGS